MSEQITKIIDPEAKDQAEAGRLSMEELMVRRDIDADLVRFPAPAAYNVIVTKVGALAAKFEKNGQVSKANKIRAFGEPYRKLMSEHADLKKLSQLVTEVNSKPPHLSPSLETQQ